MSYILSAACGCNTGKRRQNNEDNFYFYGQFLPENNNGTDRILTCRSPLTDQAVDFAVFDGMGGHADGQTASNLAASIFADSVRLGGANHEQILYDTVLGMSNAVWQKAAAALNNMGTTAAILRFTGNAFYLSNVGDSRIYLYRSGNLQQISYDHTDEAFMRGMGIKDRKPRLTQYVGVSPEELALQPYLIRGGIAEGDVYLLCSDGLTDMVSAEDITSVLSAQSDAAWKVNELISRALQNGGKDNVTVIVVQVEAENAYSGYTGGAGPDYREPTENKSGVPFKILIAVAAAVVVVIIGILAYLFGPGREPQENTETTETTTSEEGIKDDRQTEPAGIRRENAVSGETNSGQTVDIKDGGDSLETGGDEANGPGAGRGDADRPGAGRDDADRPGANEGSTSGEDTGEGTTGAGNSEGDQEGEQDNDGSSTDENEPAQNDDEEDASKKLEEEVDSLKRF